ncbi:mannitol dehydrogenase family protein [Microbacterium sp. W1N]|uniref:mannitol dehydrogenase family protein n=1 Tax=Microbacterium festucae TaxID=2977531 RepID=UPI0021BFA1C1|nr:mannitol dehydrogenase family protein [Microbacterium festucae]MCT9821360.1 mannitol dehydrogenase family protein [Microbacterium festucae]
MTYAPLQRTSAAPPVRIVHLGLGAFSRSHIAWYTAHAADAHAWGIAAYTGNSTALVDELRAQDGLYTLVTRSAESDLCEQIESVVRVHPGNDLTSLLADLAAPTTAVVTLTITEAGYRAGRDGGPDPDDPLVAADRIALSALSSHRDLASMDVRTALGRLVLGLAARGRAGGGPVALVSCDNLPDNGGLLRTCVLALAAVDPATAAWCAQNVSFVSSSVDRITPRIERDELTALQVMLQDRAPVVSEPFADWVLSGPFPAGRPRWESAGARFTDELEPWEARKLWLLNGAHTILATVGPLVGRDAVADAIAHPVCRRAVSAFWDEAQRHLPAGLEIAAYRRALLSRFENPRIRHPLSQIRVDTETKLRLRIVPVARLERACGRPADAAAFAVGAWAAGARTRGRREDTVAAIGRVAPDLADDAPFVAAVMRAVDQLASLTLV